MIRPCVFAYAVPGPLWLEDRRQEEFNLHALVSDAMSIERRLPKGVADENERARYDLCCGQIESCVASLTLQAVESTQHFMSTEEPLPVLQLDSGYLEAQSSLLRRYPREARGIRLAASFFPPDTLSVHVAGLRELLKNEPHDFVGRSAVLARLEFLEEAERRGCGVVEVHDSFCHKESTQLQQSASAVEHDDAEGTNQEDLLERGGLSLHEVLKGELARAVEDGGGAVNFSNQPHSVITEVLNEFVYSPSPSGHSAQVRVVYNDGSEARPFPLHCLQKGAITVLETLRPNALSVVLISMRHLQLDRRADLAWFRNREASKSRTLAEADTFCFELSRQQFRQTRGVDGLLIHLIQTGFQPAVIGFYRALVCELLERQGQPVLAVCPVYFSRTGREEGEGQAWL